MTMNVTSTWIRSEEASTISTTPEIIWAPDPSVETALDRFTAWLRQERGVDVGTYNELWQWSVDDIEAFWHAIWDRFEIGDPVERADVLPEEAMPSPIWFRGSRVNAAEFLLRPRVDGASPAIHTAGEDGSVTTVSWDELRRQTGNLAATMKELGVNRGDVVVGYLPNIAESLIAFLATASLGALWAGVGQDYAAQAATDRFAQLEPVLLIAADGHLFNGVERDQREAVRELRANLHGLRAVIGVRRLGPGLDDVIDWSDAVATDVPFDPVATDFNDPLWVLFSSGTTGLPKGIVHSHGGVVIEQAKSGNLNWDMGPDDVYFWYTSPSWVMWNSLAGALGSGTTVVCFDGAPRPTGEASLWKLVADLGVTIFGASPGFLMMSQDAGVRPSAEHDLSRLRMMGSTGSPLAQRSFTYVRDEVGPIPLFSQSGGTDVCASFALGAPTVPVWSGELSVRGLGIATAAWDDDGHPVVDHVGELVVTRPMPSMPLRFWDDPQGAKYHAAYFETFPGVWRHGDWISVTDRGSVIVHGRSDSTLNRNGIRMGSADIYAAVESMEEITEALVIGAEETDGGYWMPLFVVLQDGFTLDDELIDRVRSRIKTMASPRHVPDEVVAIRGIPHTKTGKKLEVPIKRLIQGADVKDVVAATAVDDFTLIEDFQDIAERRLKQVAERSR